MKVNSRLIALMVAMAAGTAAAAGTNTQAGTEIKNVASATFTDPSTGNPVLTPVLSNEVITKVTPITGFDIIYKGSQADGTTATTPATGTPTYEIPNVAAASSTPTTYTVVNNSNINGYVVNLAADTTGTANAPASVKYYPAGTTSFVAANEITSVTLADTGVNSIKDIIQVITITGGAAGQQFSASPRGTAPASTDTTAYPTAPASGAFAQYIEATNNTTTGDLQFTRVTVATAVVTLQPPTDTDPVTPGIQSPTTVPTPTTPLPPTVPTTNPTYPSPTNNPQGPTNNPGTVITADPTTGNQFAYPKSDVDTGTPVDDVVTFVSQVKNDGPVADVMIIKPTLPAGATSITALDKNGNALTPDGTGKYTIDFDPSTPAIDPTPNGMSAPFQVVVTYPDSDLTPATVASPIVVPIEVFSGNVPSTTPLDTGSLTIYPPDMQFGDTDTAVPEGLSDKTPTETVTPGQPTNTTPLAGDSSAVFPMTVRNTGAYPETYTLTAPDVIFKDVNGNNLPAATVTYYDKATGNPLPAGVTPVIASGASADFYAVVNVPAGAVATTGPYIATPTAANPFPQPQVLQTATGNYSGDKATDVNDEIKVAVINTNTDPVTGNPTSGIDVDKYQTVDPVGAPVVAAPVGTAAEKNQVSAAPKDTIRYAIIAKNNFNSVVKNFVLVDSNATGTTNVYTFSDFVSASVATTGFGATKTPYFSTDGGTSWTTAAPTAVTASGIQVYIDTDGVQGASNAPTAGDIVPATATIRLDIEVTVK